MVKKKILIFIDWYLPGYKAGGPIQSVANLVENLNDEFDFSIVTRDTDYCETLPYKNVKSNEWNILPDATRVYYFSDSQLTHSNIRNLIRKENFDVVYLNGIYSVYFTLAPLYFLRKKHGKRIVIAGRGMFAKSALDVKKTKKKFFITAVKVLQLFDNVLFHATNENEKEEIKKVLGDKVQIRTAGNLPQKNRITHLPQRIKLSDSVKLVNVARIAPEKNLLFALQVLKFVKSDVEFDFYGPVYSQEYWQECKQALDQLPSNIKASYKGSIESAKVLELLKNYHFMFMPTRGENFGHIILQSLSAGCPVIISDKTPWQKLSMENTGWDLSLESPEIFADVIEQCSKMEQKEFDAMSKSAFEFAANYNNDKEIIEQNRHLFL
ncbi:MAG: glycosyltransferase family 4 protein [Bacteroidia bacterium]